MPGQEPPHDEAQPDAVLTEAAAPEVPPAAAPGSEVELKLLVDGDRLADFSQAMFITTGARNKGYTQASQGRLLRYAGAAASQ